MRIHLIGIGGIGVSALAQHYLSKGHDVSGSDLVASEITDLLKKKNVKIDIGHLDSRFRGNDNGKELPDLVVYSPAIKQDNPELKFYIEKGIRCLSYPEALGEITKQYFTIAVSGSHGKSTTTAMIGLLLQKAGFDPTVIVGTKVREFGNFAPSNGEGSNFRPGKSPYLVIEACEYEDSFLNYFPKIIVVTNIDREHLDYFKNFKNVLESFKKFAKKLPKEGFLVVNGDDKKLSINGARGNVSKFSLKQKETKEIKKILKVPGKHNVSNALAVLAVARILKIPDEVSLKSLSEFTGTWRRFEEKDSKKFLPAGRQVKIISDYAHHPTEISATLKAVREKYPKKRIWCVFQPHQHQRTYYLFNDFVKVFHFAPVDNIIITDIYDVAGREEKGISGKISSEKLVKKIAKKNAAYLPMNNIEAFIKKNPRDGGIKSGDVLVIMGAGDIYKLAEKF